MDGKLLIWPFVSIDYLEPPLTQLEKVHTCVFV